MTAPVIRLIAPSGYPHDRDAMTRGIARLRAAGCTVAGLAALDRAQTRFAGSDAERADDLNDLAVQTSLPDIALAIRGGYGATRLLTHVHYGALRERLTGAPTLLVGHSDFTAIQLALYAKAGLVTFGGPMLGPDFGASELNPFMWEQFWRVAAAPSAELTWDVDTESHLNVEGTLWGGNLAMVCSLLGTPYFPRIDGGILFVEDVGESPYRIERMLYHLYLSGVLGRQRALLLGHFTGCRPHDYDHGYDLPIAFAQIARLARIPLLRGLPFGHEPDKATLPFGVPAQLTAAAGQAHLRFAGYPCLASTVFRPDPKQAAANPVK